MKVGTDAVLLGASVDVSGAGNILEIGTGCGVIALMLAQRSQAIIDAIDIDEASVIQARQNAEASPWKDRMQFIHSSLQDYSLKSKKLYDTVVCNPPYFSRSLKSPVKTRNVARHNDTLTFTELVDISAKLITDTGSLWVILPVNEFDDFLEDARSHRFHIHYIMKITSIEDRAFQRMILQLRKIPPNTIIERQLAIKSADKSYTSEYKELTGEFYLDF